MLVNALCFYVLMSWLVHMSASGFTDDDVGYLRKQGDKTTTKSIALSRRGLGSLFEEILPNGLVRLSHRIRETGRFIQTKIGFHISCIGDFKTDHPDELYLSLAEAMQEAEKIAARGKTHDNFKATHLSHSVDSKRKKRGYATVEQVLLCYRDSMKGRPSYGDIESCLNKHLFNDYDGDKRRFEYFLSMQARDARPEHLMPVIIRMMQVKNLGSQCNRMISHVSAAMTWGKNYDTDARQNQFDIPFYFGIETNYFLGMKKYREFEKKGKQQLSDRELWLLWHESLHCMGLTGRLARILIAIGGIRQEHLLAARWADFEQDAIYPNLECETKKTGSGANYKPKAYTCALNSLCLHEVLELHNLTGHREYLFPAAERYQQVGMPELHRSKHSIDKPFKQLQVRVKAIHGFDLPHLSMGQLRTTISTRMGVAGVSDDIKELIQGHNQSNIRTERYDRYNKIREKYEALMLWENYLRELLTRPYSEITDDYPEKQKATIDNPAKVVPRPLFET